MITKAITLTSEEPLKLSNKKIEDILDDAVKSAKAVNLVYVNDAQPGILRIKKGDKLEYFFKENKIIDDEELLRIKHLVIPPAWQNVWICRLANGHLQATGLM